MSITTGIIILAVLLATYRLLDRFIPSSQPEVNDTEQFKLRTKSTWFSSLYVHIQYTTDGGKTWKTIPRARPPLYSNFSYGYSADHNWTWEALTVSLENAYDMKDYKQRFKSIELINKYIAEQEVLYHKKYAETKAEMENYYKRLNKNLNDFNS